MKPTARVIRSVAGLGLAAACLLGCPEPEPAEPFFPEDYVATFTEVRDCRSSGDHELHYVRILADSAALEPYADRVDPFPVGAVVLKEEYEFGDLDCEGEIAQWTVMRRLAEGSAPDLLDWSWQRVDFGRNVMEEDAPRCAGCHADCGEPPEGYQGTCAVP